MHILTNLSPLDGRYYSKIEELREFFSEAALMRYRILVEIEWFIFICNNLKLKGTKVWNDKEQKNLRKIYENFDLKNAEQVKKIESKTNHDVKAIEYFIKENLQNTGFEPYLEFIHFASTSEDINNLAYALMIQKSFTKVVQPLLSDLNKNLNTLSKKHKNVPMLSRTHGQAASPTTVGKEFLNFNSRLDLQFITLTKNVKAIMGKINGAVGNYNAHIVAYPEINWIEAGQKFVQKTLGLVPNLYTTQIEPHDFLSEIFDCLKRINIILIDLNKDIWTYISYGYFKQKLKEGETGSSTMPHKVNPIDFENSEGNLGIANSLLEHFSSKLPISRMQRDLTDSTVLRNVGTALGYCVLAYKNCIQGLNKLEINENLIKKDLEDKWELLAEPIQTVMRKYKIPNPYEQLKTLTRGKTVDKKIVHEFIDNLEIPSSEKNRLKMLTPLNYIGLAIKLVEKYKS